MNHYLGANLIRQTASDRTGAFELIKPENFIRSPVISVVMSVYNGKRYLHDSVDSILNQSFKDFEFIIVNDGSNDGGLEILLECQAKDPRIIIVNQSNIGLTRSLNRAIELARCEYIARQDADDISVPARLEKQLNFIKARPEMAMVGCLSDVFTADGVIRKCSDLEFSGRGIKQYLASRNLFMHGAVMMRKSCLMRVGYYREFFRHSQDYDLWLRLSQYYDIGLLPEHLYQYRVTPEAISVARGQVQERYAGIARKLHTERLATGKDSYDMLVSSYPNGLPFHNGSADEYYYHLYLAREFIAADKLNQARSELWKAWKLGCRNWKLLSLFLKSLLGVSLLNTCRKIKNLRFKV